MPENRRVRMTKRMMKEAMLELLETQSLEKITVTAVCGRADVNRSTFYSMYDDTGELLREIEDDVLAQLPETSVIPVTKTDDFLDRLEEFFTYVKENERLFRILIVKRESSSFGQRLIETVTRSYSIPFKSGNEFLDRCAYVYCVSGVIGILKEWIISGFPIGTREFAGLVLDMSAKSTS